MTTRVTCHTDEVELIPAIFWDFLFVRWDANTEGADTKSGATCRVETAESLAADRREARGLLVVNALLEP
jgi:hypothetical protein